jgi:acetyl-CoA carboxylase biotin carboxyl carrier protein
MTEYQVISPVPGTFYRKASPDAPPYVEPGARVDADTVLGLVEVMKQFFEIPAGVCGTVAEFPSITRGPAAA